MKLETRELRKHFGGIKALDGVNYSIKEGELRAIIGPNGAGKSTFFNVITKLIASDSGQVFCDGKDITKYAIWEIVQLGVARTFQLSSIFPGLTCVDSVHISMLSAKRRTRNLFGSFMRAEAEQEKSARILSDVGLYEQRDSVAHALPHGYRKRLELAIALATDPKILLLDEPTAGLNPSERIEMMQLISRLARGGYTIVFIEHDIDAVLTYAQRISVMHQGRLLAEGTPAEISSNKLVQEVYLGSGW